MGMRANGLNDNQQQAYDEAEELIKRGFVAVGVGEDLDRSDILAACNEDLKEELFQFIATQDGVNFDGLYELATKVQNEYAKVQDEMLKAFVLENVK